MKFELDERTTAAIRNWDEHHTCTLLTEGAIGGRLTFHLTPTGLGTVTVAECACGARYDATRYEDW